METMDYSSSRSGYRLAKLLHHLERNKGPKSKGTYIVVGTQAEDDLGVDVPGL